MSLHNPAKNLFPHYHHEINMIDVTNQKLFTKMEVNSGGVSPSCFLPAFRNNEVNNCFSIIRYRPKLLTHLPRSYLGQTAGIDAVCHEKSPVLSGFFAASNTAVIGETW